MHSSDVQIEGIAGACLLRTPDEESAVRGGVVALHGSALPQRDQPLFEHLGRTLTPSGYAVLTFDRRPWAHGGDTPLEVQAEDALVAVDGLRARIDRPVGLYGFSQGAWAAALAASKAPAVAFLALVGCSGVSPAAQMRYYTDELLRRAGYGQAERTELQVVRAAVEDVFRGGGDRKATTDLLASAASQPWFELAYLPPELPPETQGWPDMDYDPEPTFAAVSCPTLLMYGADEECVPAEASKRAWARATGISANTRLTVVDLPECGHFPAPGAEASSLEFPGSGFSSTYSAALETWFARGVRN